MWPLLLDMTKDESIQSLRNLELEAYSHLVSALRAQGPLNPDKRKLLKETSNALNISLERHKAEVRRALSDEKLSTIAYHVNGQNGYADDWAQEGRRTIPLMPRMAPQTSFSAIADEVAENADQNNKQLPLPANTERKRPTIIPSNQNIPGENNKSNLFRVPDAPKNEENKKRKFSEPSSLAQHLLGPPKISKIQQIYRQKTKSKAKEHITRVKPELEQPETFQNKVQHPMVLQKHPQTLKIPISSPLTSVSSNCSKINVLQNINLQQSPSATSEDQTEQVQDINNYVVQKFTEPNHNITSQPVNLSENLTNRLKLLTKSNNNIMFKTLTSSAGTNMNVDLQKTLKMCPSRKTITKTVPTTGQKLIVVSNSQTIPSSSILQRTLTIPFVKNISVKNFDKFKIVTTTATPITLATSIVSTNSFNSVKHKVVTVRTNNPCSLGKKVFPLTQLQMLNKGSIKVLPLGGKIIGKTSSTPSSMYFMNTKGSIQALSKGVNNVPVANATNVPENIEETQINLTPTSEFIDLNPTKNFEESNEATNNSLVIFGNGNPLPVEDDYDAKIDEFHIQTIPINSQDTDVEEKHENEAEEVIEEIEEDKSGMICLPQIDCLISGAELVDKPEKVLNFDLSSRISPERMEVEIEECTYDNNQTTILTEEQLNQSGNPNEVTEVGYLEN